MTNNLKSDITTNLMQTFNALNLVQENMDDEVYQSNRENIPQYDQYSSVPENQRMMAINSNNDAFIPLMEKMMQQLGDMQGQIQNMKQGKNGGNNSRKSNKSSSINPKTGHADVVLTGGNCPNKKSGHKDEASFRNRMEWSNDNCL